MAKIKIINWLSKFYDTKNMSGAYILYDRVLLWLLLGLVCIGFIMISSGSTAVGIRLSHDPIYFIKRMVFYYSITFFLH